MASIRLDPETKRGIATFKSIGRVVIEMIDEGRDMGGTGVGRLNIGHITCDLISGYETIDGTGLTADQAMDASLAPKWHGFIEIGGEQRRVSIDPADWVLRFHECLQRTPYTEAAHEPEAV